MYLINDLEVTKEEFTLPVENLAVWRGDGVFEALKIHDHYPFGLEKHIDRLKQSCKKQLFENCLLYTSPSPRDLSTSRMPSSA